MSCHHWTIILGVKNMIKKFAPAIVGLALLSLPVLASADALSDLQAQVQALLAQIQALQAQQTSAVSSSATSTPASAPAVAQACVNLSSTLSLDDTDADTSGDVSRLQTFLVSQGSVVYPEARVTGYFGPATLRAIQRWQSAHSIVSSGDPDTTGYGYVGPKTRVALACTTPGQVSTQSTAPNTVQNTDSTKPAILSLTSDPQSLQSVHGSATITWKTQNLVSCSLLYNIYNMTSVGYSGTKVLASSTNGSYVVNPETLVAGTDNPAYMAVFVTLVCKDANGGEQRNSVRFGPGNGYSDWNTSTVPNTLPTATPSTTSPMSYAQSAYTTYAQSTYNTSTNTNTTTNTTPNPSATITTTNTNFTITRPTFSGTAQNISQLYFGIASAASSADDNFNSLSVTIPVVNGMWTYTVPMDLPNGTWTGIVGDPKSTVPLASKGFTINTATSFGTYIGYMNGSLFIQTENISRADALTNCTLNATNNPSKTIRCTWSGSEIYNNGTTSGSGGTSYAQSTYYGQASYYAQSTYYAQGTYSATPTVDVKINGSDGPIALTDQQPITVTWTSSGVATCSIYAVWQTLGAQYANIQNIGTSGTGNWFAYAPYYPSTLRLRCQTNATVPVPYDDTVTITQPVVLPPPPSSANALSALESALRAFLGH